MENQTASVSTMKLRKPIGRRRVRSVPLSVAGESLEDFGPAHGYGVTAYRAGELQRRHNAVDGSHQNNA